jgi:hypothetical protein
LGRDFDALVGSTDAAKFEGSPVRSSFYWRSVQNPEHVAGDSIDLAFQRQSRMPMQEAAPVPTT